MEMATCYGRPHPKVKARERENRWREDKLCVCVQKRYCTILTLCSVECVVD